MINVRIPNRRRSDGLSFRLKFSSSWYYAGCGRIARNVDPQEWPPSFLERRKVEHGRFQCQTEEVVASPVIKGIQTFCKNRRSIKKNYQQS